MRATTLEETYQRYYPVIWAKCRRMLRDPVEAQDLAQETFERLWAHREALRETDAALGWAYRTATRLAVDRIRRQRVASVHTEVVRAVCGWALEAADARVGRGAAGRVEAREQLERVSRALKPRELEALLLSRVDGLTQPEIARVLETSERTVRRLLQQADSRLQRVLGESA